MKLSRKVTLIVGLIILLSCAVSLWIQQAFIMPSFLSLERDTAARNGERALEGIERELEQLAPSVSDWAYWTDTYRHALGEFPGYEEANFDEGAALTAMQLNYLAIYDKAGEAVWNLGWDPEEEEPLELGALSGERLPLDHPLLQHPDTPSAVSGLIDTARGPMLVVASPILTN